jgi:hypothetical protein
MRSVWFCIFFRHRSSSPNVIGHYTQAVWADTYLVGCAVAYFQSTGVRNLSEIEFFVLSLCWDFVYLFRFLDQNFPIIECTFAITVQLAIIAAMLFTCKELPDPPAPQVLWTATACVHIKLWRDEHSLLLCPKICTTASILMICRGQNYPLIFWRL